MDVPHSIAEIVTRIERAMQRLTQAIHPLSPASGLAPRLSDGRSVKDVLAHLTWWDQWLLVTLPADQNTPIQPIPLPLVDQIPPTDHWADEMNAKVHLYNQGWELSVIEAEFAAVPNSCSSVCQRCRSMIYTTRMAWPRSSANP